MHHTYNQRIVQRAKLKRDMSTLTAKAPADMLAVNGAATHTVTRTTPNAATRMRHGTRTQTFSPCYDYARLPQTVHPCSPTECLTMKESH